MPSSSLIKLVKEALLDEIFSSMVYNRLANLHHKKSLKSKLFEIVEVEKKHAEFWSEFLKKRDYEEISAKVSKLKLSLYLTMFRVLGLGLTLRMLEMSERDAIELYSKILKSTELKENEKKELIKILEDELIHEEEFIKEESKLGEFLAHVRDAVLGMNDGLVEILSVTAGLAGAYGNPFNVALSGLIVGVAGALSMGIEAFVSARAQRQVHEGVIHRISTATRYVAHVFKERIVEYMMRKGYSENVSQVLAEESARDHKLLSRIIAGEEHRIREESLEDPFRVGLYTGLFYAFGSFVPLVPYFLSLPIAIALLLSLILAAAALAFTGSIITISAGIGVKRKAMEMTLSGLGSAGVTLIIGRLASIVLGVEAS